MNLERGPHMDVETFKDVFCKELDMTVLTQRFLETLSKDLVMTGVYLNLHPSFDEVIIEAASQLCMTEVLRLSFVVPSVGDAAVEALIKGLSRRLKLEQSKAEKEEIFCLMENILNQNDRVTEKIFAGAATQKRVA